MLYRVVRGYNVVQKVQARTNPFLPFLVIIKSNPLKSQANKKPRGVSPGRVGFLFLAVLCGFLFRFYLGFLILKIPGMFLLETFLYFTEFIQGYCF